MRLRLPPWPTPRDRGDVERGQLRADGASEVSEEDVRLWFEAPDFDRRARRRRGRGEDGTLVGYGDVVGVSRVGRLVWIDAHDPDRCDGQCARDPGRARARAPRSGWRPAAASRRTSPEKNTVLASLLPARGYSVVRHSFRMEIDLASEPAAPDWPEGIAVRKFRPGEDDHRVYEVQEETFADQAESEPMSYEEWRHWSFGQPFDPDLWFLAEEGGELAGILLARSERAGDETLGWVSVLGVRRPWRRRGLGRALLLHSFHALRARGKPRAGLGVDGSNPTGAVQLYEAAGMRVVRRSDHWEKLHAS